LSGARTLNTGLYNMSNGNALVDAEFYYRHVSIAAPYLELIEEFTLSELMRFHANVKPFVDGVTPESAAALANLKDALRKPIKLYSSGMKQRVKLLLAVLSNVPVVLLDEPGTNLDAQGSSWYKALIREYCSNRTVVIASNDPHEYDFCNHRLNVMDYKPRR
jgi:ABC-2 type transport system ATP-binding protein